ncbi:MAG: mycofactocin biosynthesis chaperone MftB [Clostridia bacterium]|jgi:putative mycofactocin binding protein MftB|nr:mycofactocin biosynthesis chaperone MftB [Clostridia bacterium]
MEIIKMLDRVIKLTPGVRVRREKFGGILYHHQTGKITFIYNYLVVKVLEQQEHKTVAAILSDCGNWDISSIAKALKILDALEAGGIIYDG